MMLFDAACGGDEGVAALQHAADAGEVAAQNSHYGLYNLGHAYEFGTGVAPDIQQAALNLSRDEIEEAQRIARQIIAIF